MDYRDLNDNELLDYISESNEDAKEILFKKYKPLIINTAKKMYVNNNGLELSDLIQEGMLGLNIAIDRFCGNKDIMFYTYAKVCIEHRISSAVTSSKRLKHKILNDSVSFEGLNENGIEYNFDRILSNEYDNPEYKIILTEKENEIINEVKKKLTSLEEQIFELKIKGFEEKEISTLLNKDLKSVHNAIYRIRNKVKTILK